MRSRRNDCWFVARTMVVFLGVTGQPCRPAQLRAETLKAFDSYVSAREALMKRDAGKGAFLSVDMLPQEGKTASYAQLKKGDVVIRNSREDSLAGSSVPGGLIHDWTGIVFVPNVSLQQTLALLQDYDHDDRYYRPDVVKSKMLGRSGDEFRVFLQLRKEYVVTTVFNTEYDVRYSLLDPTHADSCSYSTRIAEVENPGQPGEREKPPGEDHGFLWRLYSYWHFQQADGGTYIQCEAISLTRDVPMGLGWMVKPFIEKIPVESLRFTLTSTRDALLQTNHGAEIQSGESRGASAGK
jgi:hypothetical protein